MVKGTFKGHFYLKGSHDLVGQFSQRVADNTYRVAMELWKIAVAKQPESNDLI